MKLFTRIAAPALLGLVLATNALAEESPATSPLLGKWRLIAVEGKSPEKYKVRVHRVEFHADNTLTYLTQATPDTLAGMVMQGDGKWSLDGDQLTYAVGTDAGTVKLEIKGKKLKFSPDPWIIGPSSEPVATQYSR